MGLRLHILKKKLDLIDEIEQLTNEKVSSSWYFYSYWTLKRKFKKIKKGKKNV